MNILDIGFSRFKVFKNELNLLKDLPAQVYNIGESENEGLYLKIGSKFEKPKFKLYSTINERADMVIDSYKKMDQNLGVIFSGERGLGKTLCAKLICHKMLKKGYPVIIVDKYYSGINLFLASIDQDCVILFDEFEKNFSDYKGRNKDDESTQQEHLLSLFDGTDSINSHKLFILVCNEIEDVNKYYLGRPGRFHYHIRFGYPNAKDVQEYLMENTDPQYSPAAADIVLMSSWMKFSFDSLRAIAFEINQGKTAREIVSNLNLIDTTRSYHSDLYAMKIVGSVKPIKESITDVEYFRLNSDESYCKVWFDMGDEHGYIRFRLDQVKRKSDEYDMYEIDPSKVKIGECKDVSIDSITLYGTDCMHLMSIEKLDDAK
jgi:hypothetical protein